MKDIIPVPNLVEIVQDGEEFIIKENNKSVMIQEFYGDVAYINFNKDPPNEKLTTENKEMSVNQYLYRVLNYPEVREKSRKLYKKVNGFLDITKSKEEDMYKWHRKIIFLHYYTY